MTVITDEKIDLTKDGTPIVEIEDTGETNYLGAWLTAPEVHLKHSTDNANSEGVLGIIRFKGTTKTDLGIASDPGSVDLVQIQGRAVGQGNQQRYSDVKGAVSFRGMDGAGGFTELMSIEGKNLKIASGGGINFSAYATSGNPSSNLLDDYEEGTWTPTVTSGTISVYSNSAHYIKIGRKVIAHCRISNFSDRSSSSSVNISNLPFTIGVPDSNVGFAWTDNAEKVLYLYGANAGNTQAQFYSGGSGYGTFTYSQIGNVLDSFLVSLNYITQ